MDPSRPGKERARSEDESDRAQKKQHQKGNRAKIAAQPSPVKRLLANWGTVWLFEVRLNKRISYFVEQGERRFGFTLMYSARAKFERLARQEGWSE
jgi:hypothetical protein